MGCARPAAIGLTGEPAAGNQLSQSLRRVGSQLHHPHQQPRPRRSIPGRSGRTARSRRRSAVQDRLSTAANGNIEFVKDFLVPALWTNAGSGDWGRPSPTGTATTRPTTARSRAAPAPRLPNNQSLDWVKLQNAGGGTVTISSRRRTRSASSTRSSRSTSPAGR